MQLVSKMLPFNTSVEPMTVFKIAIFQDCLCSDSPGELEDLDTWDELSLAQ
jgi:hypothetical protein